MKQLYYCRHGECEFNLEKLFAGRSDSPLTELGREQAKLAGQDIIEQGIHIDKIVSSSLWRAYETAIIIANEIGYSETDITTSDLLIERSFGLLEGTPRSEFFDSHSYLDIDLVPRAETTKALHKRATEALAFVESLPGESVLIVGHSGFYHAFRRAITGDPFSHEYVNPSFGVKNGKVYTLPALQQAAV